MTDNALEALAVLDDEDTISNLLAYCVNSAPSFARAFLSSVQGGRADSYDEVHAYTRVRLPKIGAPDLVLKAKSGKHCDLIVIENKVMAEEGKDQTERYACGDSVRSLWLKLSQKAPLGEPGEPHLIFLTLFPWQNPRSKVFGHITYECLLQGVNSYERGQDAVADRLFNDLSRAYLAFYASGRPGSGDLLMWKWSHKTARDPLLRRFGELDSAFLHFGNVFEQMPYPSGLKAGIVGRMSALGHPFYAAPILKDAWRSCDTAEGPGFNIHFEAQFSTRSSRFSFYLHHEIRDYLPRKRAEAVHAGKLHGYDEMRCKFKEYLVLLR